MEKDRTNTDYRILLEKYTDNNLTKEEAAQLCRWYLSIDSQEELTTFYRQKWEEAPEEMDQTLQRQILNELNRKRAVAPVVNNRRLRIFSAWKKYAAVLLLVLAGATFVYWFASINILTGKDSAAFSVVVARGQKSTFYLSDGTVVWLNSDSRLSYFSDYNTDRRIVHLEGEAYFEVAKDARRPFIVKVRELEVEALGTCFNVKAYNSDERIIATLLDGSIAVRAQQSSLVLMPSERAIYNKKTIRLEKNRPANAQAAISWKNNELSFEGETLQQIAQTLQRLYNVNIIFESERLKQIRFTGKITNNNLENVFQLINMTSPVVYAVQGDTIVLKDNQSKIFQSINH
jgi:ferric-dicitrate binding protein FerR (iron transport regulator)